MPQSKVPGNPGNTPASRSANGVPPDGIAKSTQWAVIAMPRTGAARKAALHDARLPLLLAQEGGVTRSIPRHMNTTASSHNSPFFGPAK